MKRIDSAILQTPVEGINLRPGSLADQLGDRVVLLNFLRHLGCIFCRESVKDLRQLAQSNPSYPPVIFFYQGTIEDGKEVFNRLWPEAPAIADKEQRFYEAFALRRGSLTQLLGPSVWARGIEAMRKGNRAGLPVGDVRMMPGFFLVRGDQIIWEYKSKNSADHPDFARIPEYAGA